MNIYDLSLYLVPGSHPSDWRSGIPIEFLPVLRACYPDCIDTSILAVQLVREARCWSFRVTHVGGVRIGPVTPLSQDHGDCYDFSDYPDDQFPTELLQCTLQSDRIDAWQSNFGIFKPTAFEMLRRVQQDVQEECADALSQEYEERADFFRSVAVMLASQISNEIDLEMSVVSALKSETSFGLRVDDCESRWAEIGAETADPSILYEQMRSDVVGKVWEHFCHLPRATQVAVWFELHADREFPGEENLLRWDPPRGAIDKLKLFDMDDFCDRIARKVMSLAADDRQFQ